MPTTDEILNQDYQ
jgi:hypothetical protein